jgi:hypothetical protein
MSSGNAQKLIVNCAVTDHYAVPVSISQPFIAAQSGNLAPRFGDNERNGSTIPWVFEHGESARVLTGGYRKGSIDGRELNWS